jgi:hypothetical protein
MAGMALMVGRARRGRGESHPPVINGGAGDRDPERSDDNGLEGQNLGWGGARGWGGGGWGWGGGADGGGSIPGHRGLWTGVERLTAPSWLSVWHLGYRPNCPSLQPRHYPNQRSSLTTRLEMLSAKETRI